MLGSNYPNYDRVLPKNNYNILRIERKRFLSIIKRAITFSDKLFSTVTLQLANDNLKLFSSDDNYSYESEEEHKVDYRGDKLKITFSCKYLLEILSNLSFKEVEFRLGTQKDPGLVVSSEEHKLVSLLMPVS